MNKQQRIDASRGMYFILVSANRGGTLTATELAECYVVDVDHPEWLDDSDHDIWEIAYKVTEAYPKRVTQKGLDNLYNSNIL